MRETLVTQQQQLAHQQLPWLQQIRHAALQTFLEKNFPTTRDEQWKYTNVAALTQRPLHLAAPDTTLTAAQLHPWLMSEHYAVIVNGYFAPSLSSLKQLPEGVIVSSLAMQIERAQTVVTQQLTSIEKYQQDGFAALNRALLNDGIFVYVPPQIQLAQPLQLLFVATEAAWIQPRNLIVLAQGAQLDLVESFYSTTAAATNVVTEIQLATSSQLNYLKVQRECAQAYHVGRTHIQQADHSAAYAHTFSAGGEIARSDVQIRFAGASAKSVLSGLYVTRGKQHIDQHTVIDHAAPDCYSREFYRGILADHSRAVFNGKLIVQPYAKHTRAEQLNHNILLSSTAEIDSKPELEIYHDDVQCSHGAAIGQLDEAALFYLRSRGLNNNEAQRLLLQGFAHKVLEDFPVASLRTQLNQYLSEVLFSR